MAFSAAAAFVIGAGVAAATIKSANPGEPAKPIPPPQAAKSPNAVDTRTGLLGAGQSGGSPGAAQTMLTGPGGVDSAELKLGKSTLLGGG